MNKRILTIFMSVTLLLLALTACSSGNSKHDDDTVAPSTATPNATTQNNTAGAVVSPEPTLPAEQEPKSQEYTEVIPFGKYVNIGNFKSGLAIASLEYDAKFGCITSDGIELVPPIYDRASFTNDGWIKVTLNGKDGYFDTEGYEVVPLGKYDYLFDFSDGLAICGVNDETSWAKAKYGYIDAQGKEVTELKYDVPHNFSEGLAIAGIATVTQEQGIVTEFQIINTAGEVVGSYIDPQQRYKEVWGFSDGLAKVKNNRDEYGYIDSTGKEVIPPQYYRANDFSHGIAQVYTRESNNSRIIDKTGENVVLPGLEYDASEGVIIAGRGTDNLIILSSSGEELVPIGTYRSITLFNDGIAQVEKDGKYGCIDKNGEIVAPLIYDFMDSSIIPAEHFAYGSIRVGVLHEGVMKYGLISTSGDTLVPCDYDSATKISDNYCLIKNEDKYGLFEITSGKEVIPTEYKDVSLKVSDGVAFVKEVESGYWGVIDFDGNAVIPFSENDLHSTSYFSGGLVSVKLENECVVYDTEGNIVVPANMFSEIYEVYEGLIVGKNADGELGAIVISQQ